MIPGSRSPSAGSPEAEVRIRPATVDEVGTLQALEDAAGRRFDELVLEDPFRDLALPEGELSVEQILASVDAGCAWVAESDEVAVGFLCAVPLGGSLFIEEIDVLPDFGRRGIGGRLMACAEDRARELDLPRLLLSTFRDVPWNAPWYARLGFEILPVDALDEEATSLREAELRRGFRRDQRVMMAKPLPARGSSA